MNYTDAILHQHDLKLEHFSVLCCDIRYVNYDIRCIYLHRKILLLDRVILLKGLYIGFVSDMPLIDDGNTI